MWGAADYTYTLASGDFSTNSHSKTSGSFTWTVSNISGTESYGWDNTYGFKFGSGNKSYPTAFKLTSSSFSSKIKKVVVTANVNSGKSCNLSVKVGSTTYGSQATINTKNNDTKEFSIADASTVNGAVELSFSSNTGPLYLEKIEVYYYSGTPQPTLSLNPTNKEFEATGNSAQAIALTASNFSSTVNSVTCAFFSDAECTSSISRPSWVNEPTVNAGKTQVSVNVADNDGAARQTWMKITASDDSKSASAVFAISQKKYTAPTGTFNKFTGELVEGDYILYYATNYNGKALKNTVTSNRLDYSEVNPNDQDKFVNPDESIIWHLAKSGDNWTIYNAAVSKYAGGTTTRNQGALLDNTNNDLALWTCSSTSTSTTYDFLNVGRAGGSSDTGNKYLRNNKSGNPAVNYGFACYASGTGAALTLYKKALPTHKVTFTAAPTGGTVEVSVGGSAM